MGELRPFTLAPAPDGQVEALEERLARMERQLAREKAARMEAEAIAETGLRALYESKQRLALLQKITDLANRSMDVHATIRATLGEICASFGWDAASAWCSDHNKLLNPCETWNPADDGNLRHFSEQTRCGVLGRGQGLPGRVFITGQPEWVPQIELLDDDPRRESALRAHLASACAFPVVLDRETVSVLEFFSHHALRRNEEIDAIMLQIGHQLGQVVERQRSWRMLQSAKHDELTGLPSRAILSERSRLAFAKHADRQQGMAMLVLDLNGFKAVNDRQGHHFGDRLLAQVARRLKRNLNRWTSKQEGRCDALLARTGGDEFVIMLGGVNNSAQLQGLARELHKALDRPFDIEEILVNVGVSIGIAASNESHADADALMRDADLAMYQAKSMGLNQTVTFTPELGLRIRDRRQIEQELRDAIGAGEFVLHYQPIYALGPQSALRGFEALIRWHHPTRGLLPPAEFISCAEEIGVISAMGHWVLREACNAIARMPAALGGDGPPPFISVNVAPDQFLQASFIDQVRDAIMRAAIAPERLKIEITENVAIMDAAQTADILTEMRAWGVQASLDDFGTGYSSLSYLKNLPLDSFKIDQSFVASLGDSRSRNIIRAMCDLAREFGLTIVAEGIEAPEQAARLAELGCQQGQGFLFGHPLPESIAFASSSRWNGREIAN